MLTTSILLGQDVSNIFYFFSARGGERGSPRRQEGGVDFLLKIPGGGSPGGRGAEGPGGCLRRIGDFGGGGEAKYFFFFGAEMSTKILSELQTHPNLHSPLVTQKGLNLKFKALKTLNLRP